MAAGRSISIGEFYASLRGVYVEFVGLSELTQPDRELAQTFEHPLKTESADLPRPSPGLSLLVHHRKRGCCSRRMHRGCARFMPRSLQRRRPGLTLHSLTVSYLLSSRPEFSGGTTGKLEAAVGTTYRWNTAVALPHTAPRFSSKPFSDRFG